MRKNYENKFSKENSRGNIEVCFTYVVFSSFAREKKISIENYKKYIEI